MDFGEIIPYIITALGGGSAELEGEVKALRDQLAYERTEHQAQIASLQKQITEITRALGIKAARQVRNGKGQFTSEKVEEPPYED